MSPEEWQQTRLIGEDDDDERLDSADDEDLDSDAAFDDSDEERFADFFSSQRKQKHKKKPTSFVDVNLNEDEDMALAKDEDEEEEEQGDADEFIDLLDVLDGKSRADMRDEDEKRPKLKGSEDEAENSDEGSEEEQEDNQDAFTTSGDEDAPEASEELQKFIAGLDTTAKKRKAETDGESAKDSRARKKRLITERTEAGAEDEFRAHTSGPKVQLSDLLAPLTSQSSNLFSLKKNTKVLSTASTKVKTLSAPLPLHARERLDREAAYEQTKGEVDKWSATMKRIREAEHLSFPLQARSSGRVSNLELAAKFKPSTQLESSIDSLLKSAKLRDEDVEQTEDAHLLETNNLTIEEVAQRRAELRQMRELMFRAEIKRRRINKIKSKTYRKIKRKEKVKGKTLEADGLEGESDIEEGRLKMEVERARERATLKHKNTGKWAKQMKQKHFDDGGREEIEEMLHRGEQLRRKIQGIGSDESEEEGSEEDQDPDTEESIMKVKKAAFEEIKELESLTGTIEHKGKKGIFEMKFMKDAMAREQARTDQIVDDFVKEVVDDGGEGSDEEQPGQLGELGTASGVLTNRSGGRLAFRPGVPQDRSGLRTLGSLASDISSVTLKSTDFVSPPASPQTTPKPSGLSSIALPVPTINEVESNPWLKRDTDSSSKAPRKKNEVFGKDSRKADKSKKKLSKMARKTQEEKEKAQEDARVEISMDQNLTLEASLKPSSSQSIPKAQSSKSIHASNPSTSVTGTIAEDDDDSDANSEVDAQEAAILKTNVNANLKGLKAIQQRDLVALAFAGDNVVREFEEVKKREIAADAPKDVDTTIPGWGSWGGQGIKRAPPKPERIKKIAGVDPKSRADYNKKNIIISEKRDKKAAKYLVKDLPYPYTSRVQFERSMERPLGKEWNTRVGFQRGTLPRIVKKPGIIIDPLEKMV